LSDDAQASHHILLQHEENTMAKGQLRSNKEVRKPKKDKTKAAAAAPTGSQVKFANATTADGKKK